MAVVAFAFALGAVLSHSSRGSGKVPTNEGPRLGDSQMQSANNGTGIPIVWGQNAFNGNVIWQGELTEIRQENSQEVGGKGGGSTSVTNVTFSYRGSFAIGICAGPITKIVKMWGNDKLLIDDSVLATDFTASDVGFNFLLSSMYSTTTDFTTQNMYIGQKLTISGSNSNNGTLTVTAIAANRVDFKEAHLLTSENPGAAITFTGSAANGLESGKITIYSGSETQTIDPVMEAEIGVDETPAHRGMAYIVFEDFDFAPWGNTFPVFRFEVEGL